jgi:hypothetical protein
MMNQWTRHYFGMVFQDHFFRTQGDEFQKFFGKIMNTRYPGDFTQTRPWGPLGDDKCDGYLPSQRKFYQCYAPDDFKKTDTIKKLNEDFSGALPFQKKYFDSWIFVHNARDGRLPSWLTLELTKLRHSYPSIIIETLGVVELHKIVLELEQVQLVDIFGPFPSLQDILAVQFKDVQPLLDYLSRQAISSDAIPSPVSPEKLEYNQLSEDVGYFLRHGMIKSGVVRNYLDQHPDKELASRVTNAFRDEYGRLKQQESDADTIFYELRTFTQGLFIQSPQTEGAVLAVLAYLFEECDIFENPPDR